MARSEIEEVRATHQSERFISPVISQGIPGFRRTVTHTQKSMTTKSCRTVRPGPGSHGDYDSIDGGNVTTSTATTDTGLSLKL